MNQILISSQSILILESVKSILFTASSDPAFANTNNELSQKELLDGLGFSALGDIKFGTSVSNTVQHAKLASELMERIIS